jgi:hypothetical protein
MLVSVRAAGSALTLEGENDAWISVLCSIPKATLAGGGDLVIAYRNAVSVMPEASLLSPSPSTARRPASLQSARHRASPPGNIRVLAGTCCVSGSTRSGLRAVQRHRVDCSMEATYELVDRDRSPGQSGFRPGLRSRQMISPRFAVSAATTDH